MRTPPKVPSARIIGNSAPGRIRLSGEELVITLPNRSTIVAPIEIASFPKYVEALDIAQRMNTRLAAELRTDADLKIIARHQREFEAAVAIGG